MARKPKTFDPDARKHWDILERYEEGKLSLKQTEEQLRDLGMAEWEVRLYVDKDQEAIDDADLL